MRPISLAQVDQRAGSSCARRRVEVVGSLSAICRTARRHPPDPRSSRVDPRRRLLDRPPPLAESSGSPATLTGIRYASGEVLRARRGLLRERRSCRLDLLLADQHRELLGPASARPFARPTSSSSADRSSRPRSPRGRSAPGVMSSPAVLRRRVDHDARSRPRTGSSCDVPGPDRLRDALADEAPARVDR